MSSNSYIDPSTIGDKEFIGGYEILNTNVKDSLKQFLSYSEEEKAIWKRFHGSLVFLLNDMVKTMSNNPNLRLQNIANNAEKMCNGVSTKLIMNNSYNLIASQTKVEFENSLLLAAQAIFLTCFMATKQTKLMPGKNQKISKFHLSMCEMFKQQYSSILPIVSQCITFKQDEPLFLPNWPPYSPSEMPISPESLTSDEYLGKYLDACLSEDSLRAVFASMDLDKIKKLDPWCGCSEVYKNGIPKTLERPKIGPLYAVSDRVEAGKDAVVSKEVFLENWNKMTNGLFEGMDWTNTIVAGGAVLSCLLPGFSLKDYGDAGANFKRMLIAEAGLPKDTTDEALEKRGICALNGFERSDIDIFLYGIESDEDASEKVEKIFQMVKNNSGGDAVFMRSQHAITLLGRNPHRDVQIVLRMYNKPSEVILGFDIDAVAVAFDGNDVYATERAMLALRARTNVVNVTRRSTTYGKRLTKYALRGFAVSVPGYLRDFGLPIPLTGPGRKQLINSVELYSSSTQQNNHKESHFGMFKNSLTEYAYLNALNPNNVNVNVPTPRGASDLVHVVLVDLEIMRSHYMMNGNNGPVDFDKRLIGGFSSFDPQQKQTKLRSWFSNVLRRSGVENKEAVENVRTTRKNNENDWKCLNDLVIEAANNQNTKDGENGLEYYELDKDERDAALPADAETIVDPLSVAFNIISDYATPMSSGFHSDDCIEWAINNPREVNGLLIGGWDFIFNGDKKQDKINTIEFMRINPGSQGPTVSNTHGILMTASFHPSSTPGFYGGYRRLIGRSVSKFSCGCGSECGKCSKYLDSLSPDIATKIAYAFIFTHFSCVPTFIYDVLKVSEEEERAKRLINSKMEKFNAAVSLVDALTGLQEARTIALQGVHSVQDSIAVINSVERDSLDKTLENNFISVMCRQVLCWPSLGTVSLRNIGEELDQFCINNSEIDGKTSIETQVALLKGNLSSLVATGGRKEDYKYWEDIINKINDAEQHLNEEAKMVFLNLSLGKESGGVGNSELIKSISNHPNPTVPPTLFKLVPSAPINPITSFGPYIQLRNEINGVKRSVERTVESLFDCEEKKVLSMMVSDNSNYSQNLLVKEFTYYALVNLRYEGDIIDIAKAALLTPVLYGSNSARSTRTMVCLSSDYSDLIIKDESVSPSIKTYATLISNSPSGVCGPLELAQILVEIITALQTGYKTTGMSHGNINERVIRVASCGVNASVSVYGFGLGENSVGDLKEGIKEDFVSLANLMKNLFERGITGTKLEEILDKMEKGEYNDPELLLNELDRITPNISKLTITIPANKVINALRSEMRQRRGSRKSVFKLKEKSERICEDLLTLAASNENASAGIVVFEYEDEKTEEERNDNKDDEYMASEREEEEEEEEEEYNDEEKEDEEMGNDAVTEKGEKEDKPAKDIRAERDAILNRLFTEIRTNPSFIPINDGSETFIHDFKFECPKCASTIIPVSILDVQTTTILRGLGALLGLLFVNAIPLGKRAAEVLPHSLLRALHYGPSFKYSSKDALIAAHDMLHDFAGSVGGGDYAKLASVVEMEMTGNTESIRDVHFEFVCPETGVCYVYDNTPDAETREGAVKVPSASWFCAAMANSHLLSARSRAYSLVAEAFGGRGARPGDGEAGGLDLLGLLSSSVFELMLLRPDVVG